MAAVLVLGASFLGRPPAGATVSVITEPDTTVDVVTDPGGEPTETEIRSRGEFWNLAIQMARADPLTGVGPFQWNVVRYDWTRTGPVVVADSHETYLQIAAEYGFQPRPVRAPPRCSPSVLIGRSLRAASPTASGWAGPAWASSSPAASSPSPR